MNYYIADLHFGHKNVISLDGRPFVSVDEMDRVIIKRWNEKVQDMDDVYILGDFCYMSERPEQWYLRQLKGKKHLILGNHDRGLLKNKEAMTFFESVEKIQYVIDGKNRIVLCHYPICEWNGFHNGVWHIYGHLHGLRGDTFLLMSLRARALNAGCMINNYVPVTLNELMENNRVFKKLDGELMESQNEKNFLIPTYLEKEGEWIVEVDGRIETGSLIYVTTEFLKVGLIYKFHNYDKDNTEKYHDHEHSFEKVLDAVLQNPEGFSIEGFETDYSEQEKRMLSKLKERILKVQENSNLNE